MAHFTYFNHSFHLHQCTLVTFLYPLWVVKVPKFECQQKNFVLQLYESSSNCHYSIIAIEERKIFCSEACCLRVSSSIWYSNYINYIGFCIHPVIRPECNKQLFPNLFRKHKSNCLGYTSCSMVVNEQNLPSFHNLFLFPVSPKPLFLTNMREINSCNETRFYFKQD